MAINEDAMEEGLRFPLHPRISEILNRWHLALAQIMPNGWSMLIGLLSVFATEQPGHIPSVDEVLLLTNLTMTNEEGNDWYYVRARANNKIVEDVPNKMDGWKARFLVVLRGLAEFGGRVWFRYGDQVRLSFKKFQTLFNIIDLTLSSFCSSRLGAQRR